MALEARIARGYGARLVVLAILMAFFGLWGVYDYALKIPRRQRLHDQRQLLEQCVTALEAEQPPGETVPETAAALEGVQRELMRVLEEAVAGQMSPQEIAAIAREAQREGQPANITLETTPEKKRWMEALQLIRAGLTSPRDRPLERYPAAHAAYERAQEEIERIGEVTAPGKYDRVTQWAFILCLPCAPYFLWAWFVTRRRIYRLDDDGTLHMPDGTWGPDEIADIDMSRWMAKSVAWVEHRDGTRVKLDDYKYRDLHLIVGALASRLHPQDWDAEAKPIGDDGSQEPAAEAASDGRKDAASDGRKDAAGDSGAGS